MTSLNNIQVTTKYLDESELSDVEYCDFLRRYYGDTRWLRYKSKKDWYASKYTHRVLLAFVNGHPVGQSCVYQVPAVINGQDTIVSWGVDSFVLPEWQGQGIGTLLQRQMHEDNINFTSAWYSPTNGAIKQKCNANEYFRLSFPYYAVSRWLGVYFELAVKKLFGKEIRVPIRIPFIYSLCKFSRIKEFDFEEIYDFNELDIHFIDRQLRTADFFIKRDMQFMQWKYFNNPSLLSRPHIIRVYDNGHQVALFSFTDPIEGKYISARVTTSMLLDSFIERESGLNEKDIIMYIIKYYRSQDITIDGIRSLRDFKYYPKIVYPIGGVPLLSTYRGNIDSYYLSLIDQDMEQIAL